MIRKFTPLFLMGCFFVSYSAVAQIESKDNAAKVDIVKVYEQVIKEGYPSKQIYQELAMAQYFRSNYKEAKKWFEAWFKLEMPNDPTVLHRYKQTLKALKLPVDENQYLAASAVKGN